MESFFLFCLEFKLKKFKKITIIDAKGKKHKLETNLDRLYEIDDEMEDVEFFEIYDDEA